MRALAILAMALCCADLAACAQHPVQPAKASNVKVQTESIQIQDSFISCVTPELETFPIGASTCPNGWREGGVCHFPDGKKEFVEDSEAAIDSCEKRGGKLEAA